MAFYLSIVLNIILAFTLSPSNVYAKAADCKKGNCAEEQPVEDGPIDAAPPLTEDEKKDCRPASGGSGSGKCNIQKMIQDYYYNSSDGAAAAGCGSEEDRADILDDICECTKENAEKAAASCNMREMIKVIYFLNSDFSAGECAAPEMQDGLKDSMCTCTAGWAQDAAASCNVVEMEKAYNYSFSDFTEGTECETARYRNDLAGQICGCQESQPNAVDYGNYCGTNASAQPPAGAKRYEMLQTQPDAYLKKK